VESGCGLSGSAGFPSPPTSPEPGAKRRAKGLEAHGARRTPERKRRRAGLRSHEERQGGQLCRKVRKPQALEVRRETKAFVSGCLYEVAFGSRRCEVKRPKGGSRSLKPKQAPAQVGRNTEQDFY